MAEKLDEKCKQVKSYLLQKLVKGQKQKLNGNQIDKILEMINKLEDKKAKKCVLRVLEKKVQSSQKSN